MNHAELTLMIRHLLDSQRLAVVATSMDVSPYASLVGFLHSEDLRSIVFATLRDTRKFRNLVSDCHVSLLIDNRRNDASDLYEASAVTIMGTASEITDSVALADISARFLAKHPCLSEFIRSPNCALISVDILQYHYVNRFQNVVMMEFSR